MIILYFQLFHGVAANTQLGQDFNNNKDIQRYLSFLHIQLYNIKEHTGIIHSYSSLLKHSTLL